jgi:hypothetical protein
MSIWSFIRSAILFLCIFVHVCCNKPSPDSTQKENYLSVTNSINGRYLIRVNDNPIHSGTYNKTLNSDILKSGQNKISYHFDVVPPPSDMTYFSINYGNQTLAETTGDSPHIIEKRSQSVTFNSSISQTSHIRFKLLETSTVNRDVPEKLMSFLEAFTSIDTQSMAEHLCQPEDLLRESFKDEALWPLSSREVFVASPDEIEFIIGPQTVLARLKA